MSHESSEAPPEIRPPESEDFFDPWGNHIQVVDYGDVQFTKTDRIIEGMGLAGLEKRPQAVAELRAKGLAD